MITTNRFYKLFIIYIIASAFSWDIWHNPAKLAESVSNSFSPTNLLFVILLTMMLFVLYLAFSGVVNMGEDRNKE